ncbi:hypothetical protein LSF60_16445 [Rhodococcus pyridinivorans]|uniref:hypothetical protein n=1 Tax=Rhodococcus pyridinivorans TaxID=103816 RepID=UPI001E2E3F28|nr:hypothetical protein [Rhodococcus pyridinivorans]UGQ56894.1 hypothetical protein LSF60_16445 [Rhodococcus pyridinivorans]
MSSSDPRSWIDRLVGACIGLLVGVIALYCAVQILRMLLPFLVAAIGVLAIGSGLVTARRWYHGRW